MRFKPVIHEHIYRGLYDEILRQPKFLRVQNILMVVDDNISTVPSPTGFGIGKIAKIIDDADFGFARTRVTLATRDGAVAKHNLTAAQRLTQPTYTGFRFHQIEPGASDRSIDHFDQIWCFGFRPGIHNPAAGDDAIIDAMLAQPETALETAAMQDWMDNHRGGVLAMGDHGLLGAEIAIRIPRIRRMRAWTVAQGVPTRTGTTRLDTNRPGNASETYNAVTNPHPASMDNDNQGDRVPQPIDWTPESSFTRGLRVFERPHPILCHPDLGPIDVFPDHAHEGRCFGADQIADLSDFPTVDGVQPLPKIIATATTLQDPPWKHEKGAQPARTFPVVSVYDGQRINHGRCVVDSTWHHWFDINIHQLEQENGSEWAKVKRYFENVAVWLAKPSWRSHMVTWPLVALPFSYHYFQELDRKTSVRELGLSMIDYLRPLGPCWVSHWLIDILDDLPLEVNWRDELIGPRPECLTCPPWPLIEETVFGELARLALDNADRVHQRVAREGKIAVDELGIPELMRAAREGLARGLMTTVKEYRESLRHTEQMLERMEHGAKQIGARLAH